MHYDITVSTIRRALRELIGAGLLTFKSWVCKKLKVFALLWDPRVKPEDKLGRSTVIATKDKEVAPKTSPFLRDQSGQLCFRADQEDQVREVAYKLVDIGLSKDGAIEMMGKRGLAGCKELLNDLALLEQSGQKIEDKAAWFMSRVC